MSAFEDEVEGNWKAFRKTWTTQATSNWTDIGANQAFLESYRRISALNALRVSILKGKLPNEAYAFFLEAQNDALMSHVNASFGAWRTALQALRGCIENALCALYYKDHPVELALWAQGEHRITFTALTAYMQKHPLIASLGEVVTGTAALAKEYNTLSKAVHASASGFRMTGNVSEVLLWSNKAASLGAWRTRERQVVEGVCLSTVALFKDQLLGNRLPNVRGILYYALSNNKRTLLKSKCNVHIAKP